MCGTRWPDWISLFEDLQVEAEERGELLPHAVHAEIARLVVGAWTAAGEPGPVRGDSAALPVDPAECRHHRCPRHAGHLPYRAKRLLEWAP